MGTSEVVADSNVLLKWFVPEDYSDKASELLKDHLMGVTEVTAPKYALLEFSNALRKYVVRGGMSGEEALKALHLLLRTRVNFVTIDEGQTREALNYSLRHQVTVYDAYYVVLARRLGVPAYTADGKLLKKLQGKETLIKHIKEYVPFPTRGVSESP